MDPMAFQMLAKEAPEIQNMLKNNPDAMKQADGFWKFLNNLAESSPDEYQKFIDG